MNSSATSRSHFSVSPTLNKENDICFSLSCTLSGALISNVSTMWTWEAPQPLTPAYKHRHCEHVSISSLAFSSKHRCAQVQPLRTMSMAGDLHGPLACISTHSIQPVSMCSLDTHQTVRMSHSSVSLFKNTLNSSKISNFTGCCLHGYCTMEASYMWKMCLIWRMFQNAWISAHDFSRFVSVWH